MILIYLNKYADIDWIGKNGKDLNYRLKQYEIKIIDLENENIKLKNKIKTLENALKNFKNAISGTIK